MNNPESLYSQVTYEIPSLDDSFLPLDVQNYHFAMRCNGYFMNEAGDWVFSPSSTRPFVNEFKGQRVAFFGPNSTDRFFSAERLVNHLSLSAALSRPSVKDLIGKYRAVDEDQAARLSFLLGGIVRMGLSDSWTREAIDFTAHMGMFGERKSGDALVSAVAMFVLSGGSCESDREFAGNLYRMSEAVVKDQVVPIKTADLGLSQTARLDAFLRSVGMGGHAVFPDTTAYDADFTGFPTVGAEFHFHLDAPQIFPNFWKRLAFLNMSQYQRGSFVQFSRNDREVIEVRMNPSIYPVTVANWKHLRLILPELNSAYFTITLNRSGENENFEWKKRDDTELLNKLRALGMMGYAGIFANIPDTEKREEIDFGTIYLGQTVRLVEKDYAFTGNWGGGEGEKGQLGIYAGFGDNLPFLAYYLSMALANPGILNSLNGDVLKEMNSLRNALCLNPDTLTDVSREIQTQIASDARLRAASEAGRNIVELLSP